MNVFNDKNLFTNRKSELNILRRAVEDLDEGIVRNIALFGLRRIGKTFLIQRFFKALIKSDKIYPIYINLEDMVTSPELFTERYVGSISFELFSEVDSNIYDFLTIENLIKVSFKSRVVSETASLIFSELQKEHPDKELLLKIAFDFPQKIAEEKNCKLIIALDEFQYLNIFENFRVTNPLGIFRNSIASQNRCLYIIAGSAISIMRETITSQSSPLFLQFEMLELSNFDKSNSVELSKKIMPEIPDDAAVEIFTYTRGNPFYINALTNRLKRMNYSTEMTKDLVRKAFIIEALSKTGQIYNYCKYIFDISLEKARGYGNLKAILQLLSEKDGLTRAEIAKGIRKGYGPVGPYLNSLVSVDLLIQESNLFYFRDPVLKFWVAATQRGIEVPEFNHKKELLKTISLMENKIQELSTEIGVLKEGEIRNIFHKFNNQIIPGKILGVHENIKLPHFNEIQRFISSSGQVEIDVLAKNSESWACEINWGSKLAGKKDLFSFLNKAKGLAKKYWYISKIGFTKEARDFAKENKIYISSRTEISALIKKL